MKTNFFFSVLGLTLATSLAAVATPMPPPRGSIQSTNVQAPSAPGTITPEVRRAWERVNELRRAAGVPPVELDATLSKGCQSHAKYLNLNRANGAIRGMGAHSEQEGLPGYTEAGAAAAVNSVIAPRRGLSEAVDAWMSTLYHRIPMLRPNLVRIGLGWEGGYAVMDVINGLIGDEPHPVAYPAEGQKNVPTLFPNELPDPIPAGATRPAGYPVTLQFPFDSEEVTGVKAAFMDVSGKAVPFHLSSPEHPANAFPQQNTICVIPARRLAPGATYKVRVAGTFQGETFEHEWSFTTETAPRQASSQRNLADFRPVTGPVPVKLRRK